MSSDSTITVPGKWNIAGEEIAVQLRSGEPRMLLRVLEVRMQGERVPTGAIGSGALRRVDDHAAVPVPRLRARRG